MTGRKHKQVWVLAIALVLLGGGVFLQSLWLPWILPSLVGRYGVHLGRIERVGLSRLAIYHVAWSNQQARLSVGRLEVPTPSGLVWNRLLGDGSELRIQDWTLAIMDGPGEPTAPAPSVRAVFDQTTTNWRRWEPWVSRATLERGRLELQQQTSAVPRLDWTKGSLVGEVRPLISEIGIVPVDLSIRFDNGGGLLATLNAPSRECGVEIQAGMENGGLEVRAAPFWQSNRAAIQARFTDGLLPDEARLVATRVAVPKVASVLIGDASAHLDIEVAWTNRAYGLRLSMVGGTDESSASRELGLIRAHGDPLTLTVDQVFVSGPNMNGALVSPVTLNYRGNWLESAARMTVTGDLARLSIPGLAGTISSDLDLQPNPGGIPIGNLHFAFTNASYLGSDLSGTAGTLEFRWPLLVFAAARSRTESGSGLEIEASARADLVRHEVENAAIRVSGGGPVNSSATGVVVSNLSLRAAAVGSITNLQHDVTAQFRNVRIGPLAPMDLEVREKGSGFQNLDLHAFVAGSETFLELKGSLGAMDSTLVARWEAFNVWTGAVARTAEGLLAPPAATTTPLWSLAEPVTMKGSGSGGWMGFNSFEMTSWRWVGEERRWTVDAGRVSPAIGRLQIAAAGVRLGDFTNLLAAPIPWHVQVEELELGARWSNGPVGFVFETTAALGGPRMPDAVLTLQATNAAETMVVPALRLAVATTSGGRPDQEVIRGQAVLPFSATGTADGIGFIVHSNAPFHLELQASTNGAVSELLATFGKVDVTHPSVRVVVDGPIGQPTGAMVFSADSMVPRPNSAGGLPRFDAFSAALAMDGQRLMVRDLRTTLAGRPLLATADIPYSIGSGEGLRFQWDRARARLQATDVDLAALAVVAPAFMAPRGRLDLDLRLEPDFQLQGHLHVADAATPSLPGFGPVGGIDARIVLDGRKAVIERVGARVAGAPVAATGVVDFGEWRPGTADWPAMNVGITATNLAFIRESQKILRGDLDLRFTNAPGATPSIAGDVVLREGLFLANLTDLVPRGVTEVSQRPPYFGVSSPLFQRWPLRVRVRGEKFLSVRTTLFHGDVSASLELQGDLGEPVAVGQVQIASGAVSFPFATLPVRQGFVTLSSSSPYDPGLFVNAAGRAYDYDLRLEVTGSAQKPRLEFSSVPPLTSEQILLMVTSGKIPRDDFNLTTRQRAERLGMFLGKDVLSQLGFGGTSDRLVVHSGESISENGRSTYSVEYKLTDDVSVVGEYDRFDEYNVGVQWRVYSR